MVATSDGLLAHDGDYLTRGWIRKASAVITVVVFVVTIVGTGVIDGFFPLPEPKVIGKEKQELDKRRREARFRDGSLARLIEYDLRTRSRVRSWVHPYYAALLYSLLNEAQTSAILGTDGWVFLRNRVIVDPRDEQRRTIISERIITALDRRLKQAGTRLIVLAIPRKSVLYRDKLGRSHDPRIQLYPDLMRRLRNRGVKHVDLLAEFRAHGGEVLFRKIDSHWNDRGMFVAAEALAKVMGHLLPEDKRPFAVKNLGLRRDPGDLLRLIGIDKDSKAASLIDWPRYDTIRPCDALGRAVKTGKNPPLPVDTASSGTSFTYNCYFPDFVRNATGLPIWYGAWPAIGPVEPLRRTLHAFRNHGLPKTLIWEIPAHNLFCIRRPLSNSGRLFSEIQGGHSRTLSAWGVGIGFRPGSSLKPGVYDLQKKPLRAFTRRGALVFEPAGSIAVRLRGRLQGGDAAVAVDSGRYRLYSRWHEGDTELVLPVIGPAALADVINVTLSAASKTPHLTLDAIELVTDLGNEAGVKASAGQIRRTAGGSEQVMLLDRPHTIAAREALLFALDVKGPFAGKLEIVAEGAFGEKKLPRLARILPQGVALIDLNALRGVTVSGFRLRVPGKLPGRLLGRIRPVLLVPKM